MSRDVCGICMCPYDDDGSCGCKQSNRENEMNKQEALQTIKLLSALESWSMSGGHRLPDYLHDDLQSALDILEKIVLKEETK